MDDTQARAQVDVLTNEYDGLIAQRARLSRSWPSAQVLVFRPSCWRGGSDPRVGAA